MIKPNLGHFPVFHTQKILLKIYGSPLKRIVKWAFFANFPEQRTRIKLMSSQTLFLQPTGSTTETNFVDATGSAVFRNFSLPASNASNSIDLEELIIGGVADAVVNAEAVFLNNPTFTSLFTETFAEGQEGEFKVKNKSTAEVEAIFDIPAGETFSFDFSGEISLTAKEIENPDAEFSRVKSKTSFLVLDTTDPDDPEVLDFFGIEGKLISSEKTASRKSGASSNVNFTTEINQDVDGNNGEDFLDINVLSGTYSRTFDSDIQISIIETNATASKLLGDTFIDNLGDDVIYGSIWADNISGDNADNKIYGSRLKDKIRGRGGDDILEGGGGRDLLIGNNGDDQIHGGDGSDVLNGGRGSDTLAGGRSKDTFVFADGFSFRNGELDIILDFQPGLDQVKFRKFDTFDPLSLITDTASGAILTLETGGELLFEGISSSQLSTTDFIFV